MKEKRYTLDFGKIDYWGRGRKVNRVTVDITFRFKVNDDNGRIETELAIVGNIWNASETDIVCGGQIIDELRPILRRKGLARVSEIWDTWHLKYISDDLIEELMEIIKVQS